MQRLLSHVQWDEEAARELCRGYVVEHLADREGVLIVDETGFVKKGTKSVGVARQYSGTAGRIENCQIGVFLAYASGNGHALIDRELYLPKEWAEDPARRKAASIPQEVAFATKPELARRMIARAIAAGCAVRLGSGRRGLWLRSSPADRSGAAGAPVCARHPQQREAVVDARWQAGRAHRRRAGGSRIGRGVAAPLGGRRGQRRAVLRLGAGSDAPATAALGSLAARSSSSSKPDQLAYYVVFGPADTPLATLARVAGRRWAIEECFKVAKQEVGLADYEIRSRHGWYRHVTLAMLALAFLAVMRVKLKPAPATGTANGKKGQSEPDLWSISAQMKSAISSAACNRAPAKLGHVLAWSLWRRLHQAAAKICHWKRRRKRHAA